MTRQDCCSQTGGGLKPIGSGTQAGLRGRCTKHATPKIFQVLLIAIALGAIAACASAQSQPSSPFSCSFASINTNDWVGINILAVTAVMLLAAIIYAISNFLPSYERREKLKGITKYEIIEAILSVIILVILIGFASAACDAGSALAVQGSYTGLYNFVDSYVGNLLFKNGVSLMSSIYGASINFMITSNIFYYASSILSGLLGSFAVYGEIVYVGVSFDLSMIMLTYSTVLTYYGGLVLVTFAPLFILYVILPFFQQVMLTVVAPTALAMRSAGFLNPRIRELSNMFLALAIGLYFVLPLLLAFNAYVVNCLGIQGIVVTSAVKCSYPYAQFISSGYSLPDVSSSIFQNSALNGINSNIPFAASFGALTTFFSSAPLGNIWQYIVDAPSVLTGFGLQVAGFMFVGLVLTLLDITITVGFIAGLGRGLNAVSSLFSPGSFWG